MDRKIYDINIEALKKCFPGLAYKIEHNLYEIKEDIEMKTEFTKDNDITLKIIKDNRVLFTNGKYGPKEEAKRLVNNLGKVNRKATIFLFGIGNAMLIKELLTQTIEEVNIALFEPSIEIFLEVLHSIDIHEIFEKRVIGLVIEGLNGEEKQAIIESFITFGNIPYLKKIIHPNYSELFPEEIIEYMKLIQKLIDKIMIMEKTRVEFSNVWTENLFRNITYICDNYKADQICRVVPLDIPAIIVSAGPSLNKNIKDLKKAKNKAFIIAVDTALKPLIKEGIIPDLFVAVDGKKPLDLFQIDGVEDIPMLVAITSEWKISKLHKGKKFFYREQFRYVNEIFDKLEIVFRSISTGGSVANTAFSFAYLSGFSTIILVGQDLALTNNKTHADGTFKEVMDEIDTKNAIMVEGNIKSLVPTRYDLKLYLDWFNYYIENAEDVKVINATEGGAKIKNTEIMTLKEAINRECKYEVDISECYKKLEPMFTVEERKKVIEYLHSTPDMLNDMKKKARDILKQYNRLSTIGKNKQKDNNSYIKINKKISKIVKEIEDMPIASVVLECMGVANYLIKSEVYEKEETFNEEILEISRKGILLMKNIIYCIDILMPLVEETVCKVI